MNTKFSRGKLIALMLSLLVILMLTACAATANSQAIATATGPSTSTDSTPIPTALQTEGSASTFSKINLNTGTAQDFLTIPGMGNRMVNEFFEYRPYTSIQQFEREIGKYVNDEQVAEYEAYVYVPISGNESDAQTLLQIPGLDETEVTTLISGRPYSSNDVFLAKLSQYVSQDQLEVAASYLVK